MNILYYRFADCEFAYAEVTVSQNNGYLNSSSAVLNTIVENGSHAITAICILRRNRISNACKIRNRSSTAVCFNWKAFRKPIRTFTFIRTALKANERVSGCLKSKWTSNWIWNCSFRDLKSDLPFRQETPLTAPTLNLHSVYILYVFFYIFYLVCFSRAVSSLRSLETV